MSKLSNHEWGVESALVIILIILTAFLLNGVRELQETARVVNYAGLVRGATQRLVKLEMAGQPNDELIVYLDEILDGLENGGGTYELARLNFKDYRNRLEKVSQFWEGLCEEIMLLREEGDRQAEMLQLSEQYFVLTDELTNSAELYSRRKASMVRWVEFFIVIDMFLILLMLSRQTWSVLALNRKNGELNKAAYIDAPTGLFNKSRCEQVLAEEVLETETACIVLDINGLKHVNDTMGHVAGDALIVNFAHILKQSVPEEHFLGRCGGDEFVIVIKDTSHEQVEALIRNIRMEVQRFNKNSVQIAISFACGYAISSDFEEAGMQMILKKADENMYRNKREMKAAMQRNLNNA